MKLTVGKPEPKPKEDPEVSIWAELMYPDKSDGPIAIKARGHGQAFDKIIMLIHCTGEFSRIRNVTIEGFKTDELGRIVEHLEP